MSNNNDTTNIVETTIDYDGDVTILLPCTANGTAHSARVSSKCLALASSVFSAMMGPRSMFLEGTRLRSAAQLELTLDDNPDAMLLILKLLHHRSNDVPREVDLGMLYEIVLIADKYDLTEALVPWVIIWTGHHREQQLFDSASSPELQLCISWMLRDSTTFKEISRRLILETTLDASEDLVTREGNVVGEGISDRVVDALKKERGKFLDVLMKRISDELDKKARDDERLSAPKYEMMWLGLYDSDLIQIRAANAYLNRSALQVNLRGSSCETIFLSDVLKELKSGESLLEERTFSPTPLRFGSDGTLLDTEFGHQSGYFVDRIVNLAYAVEVSIVGLDLSDF